MSHFGRLVKELRAERGLSLAQVARRIGSHKGYVSAIENDQVNPPSVRLIKNYAKLFGRDARELARLAWVDKAPEILREDAERFLEWCRLGRPNSPVLDQALRAAAAKTLPGPAKPSQKSRGSAE